MELEMKTKQEEGPGPPLSLTLTSKRPALYDFAQRRKFPTVMVSLVSEALDFLADSVPFPSEPPSGAQCESRGGHPLAWVACDLLRVALSNEDDP